MTKTWYKLPLRNLAHLVKRPVLLISIAVFTVILIFYKYNLTPVGTDTSFSVLWYTKLEQGEGSSGFIQEAVNFMIPLYNLLNFGWYAGCTISDLKTNTFFAEFSEADRRILLELFVRGAQINHEMPYQNNVITVVFEQPNHYKEIFENYRMKYSIYKVGRAMFETDWIPNNWDYLINEYLDELWVPSTFAKEVFQSAGVYKPIKVIREGFDPAAFSSVLDKFEIVSNRKRFYPNCRDSDVIFISVAKMEKRKGIDILLKTWIKSFTAESPACLYIRATMSDEDRAVFKNSGLRIFELERLLNEDLVLCYQSADVFVLPTHGEGWGRPIMEAMAAGLPVIVPLWAGIAEFVKEDYSIPLHVTSLEDAFKGDEWAIGGERYQSVHHWASINTTELSSLLVWCTQHTKQLPSIGAKARAAMYASYTRGAVASDVKDRVDQIKREVGERGVRFYQRENKKRIRLRDWEETKSQLQSQKN